MNLQVVYATLIDGCVRTGETEMAWETFDHMRRHVFEPDVVRDPIGVSAVGGEGEYAALTHHTPVRLL